MTTRKHFEASVSRNRELLEKLEDKPMTTPEKMEQLVAKWRKAAKRSEESWLNLKSDDESSWATELETNKNDLRMCADELESVLAAYRVSPEPELEALRAGARTGMLKFMLAGDVGCFADRMKNLLQAEDWDAMRLTVTDFFNAARDETEKGRIAIDELEANFEEAQRQSQLGWQKVKELEIELRLAGLGEGREGGMRKYIECKHDVEIISYELMLPIQQGGGSWLAHRCKICKQVMKRERGRAASGDGEGRVNG